MAKRLTLRAPEGDASPARRRIPLDLAPAVPAASRFDEVLLRLAGLPVGAALNKGRNNGDQSWTLTAGDLVGLCYLPARPDVDEHRLDVWLIGVAGTEEAEVIGRFELAIRTDGRTPEVPSAACVDGRRTVPDYNLWAGPSAAEADAPRLGEAALAYLSGLTRRLQEMEDHIERVRAQARDEWAATAALTAAASNYDVSRDRLPSAA